MLPALYRKLRSLARPQGVTVPPVTARHVELSAIVSADDDPGQPDDYLLNVALGAVARARQISMQHVSSRMASQPDYPSIWPGEHYKLLGGLLQELQPKVVVEIGTSSGLSACGMLPYLPAGGRLVTFDLIPWKDFPDTVLSTTEFAEGRLTQVLADLAEPMTLAAHRELLESAEFIFIDGPKNGHFEPTLLNLLESLPLRGEHLLMFDDIRVWKMLDVWRRIRRPKLDVTSFGHWSGTGLVHWVAPST